MRGTTAILISALVALPAPALAQDITPDVVYGHKEGMALTYDVIHPTGTSNGAAVAYMVSGGWVSRWLPPQTMAQRPLFAQLSERGFTVFLVRHGSSPRFKVPEAVTDVSQAITHIRQNAAAYGVDPDRLGITGGSAGGHLSLSIGLRAEGADGSPQDGANPRDNQVRAIVAYYPPVDIRPLVGPSERFPALDFDPELSAGISPILFVTEDDPPTLLLHGDADTLVPIRNSQVMYAALQDVGVETEFHTFPGAGHGFRGDDAARGVALTIDWFERHLLSATEH